MNVRPRTLFRGKRGNGGWGWVEVGAVGPVDAHRRGEFCALGGSLDDLDDEDIPVARRIRGLLAGAPGGSPSLRRHLGRTSVSSDAGGLLSISRVATRDVRVRWVT